MHCLYKGKTKDVYQMESGLYWLQFKDDMTGTDGVFDPGSNEVGLTVDGAGKAGLRLTQYFFEYLKSNDVPTHYVSADIEEDAMVVKPAELFGKGLEVICRYRAVGSFWRRYGAYIEEGAPLDAFVEITLKDDARQDPPISEDALVQLEILQSGEYHELKHLTQRIAGLIQSALKSKGLELYDIKLEFGRIDDQIALIDEISGGNMRVYRDGAPVEPLDLEKIMAVE